MKALEQYLEFFLGHTPGKKADTIQLLTTSNFIDLDMTQLYCFQG